MADDDAVDESFTERIAREGEDAVARMVHELGDNSIVRLLVERAFDARERAAQAQQIALAALNLPSASDIERLTRRIRSVSLRMEGLEDGVDRLDERLAAIASGQPSEAAAEATDRRLRAIEEQLARIGADVATIAGSRGQAAASAPPPTPAKARAQTPSPVKTPAAAKRARTDSAAAKAPRQQPGRAARPR